MDIIVFSWVLISFIGFITIIFDYCFDSITKVIWGISFGFSFVVLVYILMMDYSIIKYETVITNQFHRITFSEPVKVKTKIEKKSKNFLYSKRTYHIIIKE